MNQEEAIKIIIIFMDADGGCSYCARELCLEFVEDFQEFKELTETMYKETFKEELFEEEE